MTKQIGLDLASDEYPDQIYRIFIARRYDSTVLAVVVCPSV